MPVHDLSPRRSLPRLALVLGACSLLALGLADPRDGWHWDLRDGGLGPATGSPAPSVARGARPSPQEAVHRPAPVSAGGGRVFRGDDPPLVVLGPIGPSLSGLPREALSVEAWVSVEEPLRWGGVVSCVQDDGDVEHGWVLGFDQQHFTFGLSSAGADDGDGRMTYLSGRTPHRFGAWHHVVATYDGTRTCLYVDGELDGEDTSQSGPVAYDPASNLVLGSYLDADEHHALDGRLREASLEARAWSAEEVRARYARHADLSSLEPWSDRELEFLVAPYLTWPALDAISILFESSLPCRAEVRLRRDDEPPAAARVLVPERDGRLFCLRATGLEPDRKYFYDVRLLPADAPGALPSTAPEPPFVERSGGSFRTAASPGMPFTFVAVGDTQRQADVAARVAQVGREQRPNLVLHAGDLVDTGTDPAEWTRKFFPSLGPLIAHAPLMPVLGNHEQDAELYYRYMDLPAPERWYSFRYGDAEFFMIDGNRSLAQRSEQLTWLEQALSASTATWRFAFLHQPPYTSDSDDYGDTTLEGSTRGDLNAREIVALLERHDVDICFSGHVHDYERTLPVRDGRVTPYREGGVYYVTTAGGGGPLEDFDACNTWFGHKKARVHHLVQVAVHGRQLELHALDEQGRLFDVLTLEKR